jgi:hypothetical protein
MTNASDAPCERCQRLFSELSLLPENRAAIDAAIDHAMKKHLAGLQAQITRLVDTGVQQGTRVRTALEGYEAARRRQSDGAGVEWAGVAERMARTLYGYKDEADVERLTRALLGAEDA